MTTEMSIQVTDAEAIGWLEEVLSGDYEINRHPSPFADSGAPGVTRTDQRLRALLALARDGQRFKWQSMETAPLHEPILMLCKHGAIEGVWDGESGSGYYWREIEWYAQGWMPLPAEPVTPSAEKSDA